MLIQNASGKKKNKIFKCKLQMRNYLPNFLIWSLVIFIIKCFRTKVRYGGPYMEGKGKPSALWDKDEIIDRAEHWRIRRLKESAHMLGYNDLISRPSIESNTIWELVSWKKKIWIWAQEKKSYIIVVILVK